MRILILHIGHHDPLASSRHAPSPERFKAGISPHLKCAKWTVISAVNETLPDPSDYDGYLITGGKYSVFEESEWQNRLLDLLAGVWR